MKVDRLHRLLADLANEYTEDNTDEGLDRLESALLNVVSSQSEEAAAAFRGVLSTFEEHLSAARSNSLPPSYLHLLHEIGLSDNYGVGLRDRIRRQIDSNRMVPASALTEIQRIRASLKEAHKLVVSTIKAFQRFEIPYEDLEPGEFEFGFLRPHETTDGKFETFAREIDELNLLIRTFQELAGEDVNGATVNGISACDWTVYVGMAPVAAAGLATAIERIVALYKSHLEIKLLRRQLSDKIPDLDGLIESAVDKHVAEGMKKVVAAVMESFDAVGDQARRNELENQLTIRLRWLAKRMENGTLVEVRAEPLDVLEVSLDDDTQIDSATTMLEDNRLVSLVGEVNKKTSSVLQMESKPGEHIFAELPVDSPDSPGISGTNGT